MLAVPSIAAAGDGSAVSQYTECPPQCGKVVGKKKAPLPKKSKDALAKLSNSASRNTLKNIVTKPQFGALPTASLNNAKSQPARNLNSSVGGSLQATMVSSGGGSKGRLVVLLAVIVAISGGIGAVAVRKQRS